MYIPSVLFNIIVILSYTAIYLQSFVCSGKNKYLVILFYSILFYSILTCVMT